MRVSSPLILGAALCNLCVVVTADPIAQQSYLKASNTDAEDVFGSGVAISGDTVVVGASLEDSNAKGVNGNQSNNSDLNAGAAYVFVRDGTNWTQQAYLKASNTRTLGAVFGWSAAISGDTVVVGAWGESSNATGVNGNQSNTSSVDADAAYVFVRNGTNWSQQAYLKASNTKLSNSDAVKAAWFGSSVTVSGDTIVVGAPYEDSNATGVNGDQSDHSASSAGAAYVFVRNGTNWTQQAYLKASNTDAGDSFGTSVAVSGDTVVVGAWSEASNATGVNGDQTDNSAPGAGAAYVFARSGTNWTQQAYLKASNTDGVLPGEEFGDEFGVSVAVSGDTIVVGAWGEDSIATGLNGDQSDNSAVDSGAAYVFVRNGTTWTQEAYLKASNTDAGDIFGSSVAVSGDTVVVGAAGTLGFSQGEASSATGVNGDQSDDSAPGAGAAYVFVRSGTNWTQQAYLKASNTDADDNFGFSVAVSGDTVAAGARGESSNATGVNGDQSDNSFAASGAAYVFTGLGPGPQLTIALSAQNIILSWPVGATSYILEAAPSLSAIAWDPVTNNPAIGPTERSVQLPITSAAKFFRLRSP
jgi:hypothetical protein